jgi:hypothetical protein
MNIFKKLREEKLKQDQKKPYTQEELSQIFNDMGYSISRSMITQLETDRIKDIPSYVKCAYGDFFKVSVDIFNTLHGNISDKQRVKIQRLTGLSQKAIKCLELFHTNNTFKIDLEGLNDLLENFWDSYTESQTEREITRIITVKSKDAEPKQVEIQGKTETTYPYSIFRNIAAYLSISKPKLYNLATTSETDLNSFCYFNSKGDNKSPIQANIERSLEALYKSDIVKQLEGIKAETDAKRKNKRRKQGD